MYCVKCGVELADSEKRCPLCKTEVICPSEERKESPSIYPEYPGEVNEGISRSGLMFVATVLIGIAFMLCLLCDVKINGEVVWSGYASLAIAMGYFIAVFPMWFKKPNPVIFVPIDFAIVALYLLYVNYKTAGNWFLSFAFPTVAGLGLIVSSVVTLRCCVRGGRMFIYGGAFILLGAFSVLMEFLINLTFDLKAMFAWSLYPCSVLFLLGMMFIVIGTSKPLKESLRRKLFF